MAALSIGTPAGVDGFRPSLAVISGEGLDEHALVLYIGAVGLVMVISALASGFVSRGPISQVLVFVLLGVFVGPAGLGVFDFGIDSPAVRVLSTVALTLVLFTDAININLGELRTNWLLPALALGPGGAITIGLIAVFAGLLFGLSWQLSVLVGTILASTDAVLLRDVTRDKRIPLAVRHTLSVEAGTNDIIVLPLTLLLAAVAAEAGRDASDWVRFALGLLVLGPLVGVGIAYIGIRAVSLLRARSLISNEYESLYSIGIAFVAFSAAQLVDGSGFVAAFAAGLTIAILDEELCDCFLEYGETTAEVAMLLTFVFLGAALVDSAWDALGWKTLLFALLTLAVARPAAFLTVIRHSRASRGARLLLAWFGPRGLNSLLLLILAVAEGIPNQEEVFGMVSVVVLASIVLHGTTATPLAAWYGRMVRRTSLPEEILTTAGGLLNTGDEWAGSVPRMPPAELHRRLEAGEPVTIVDIRRAQAFDSSRERIPGAIRVTLDELSERLPALPKGPPIVLYCA
jgi:NhaP-type Na+/H+ or K+/H+ antiporter